MTPRQRRRFKLIGLVMCGVALSSVFTLKAFQSSITFFLEPEAIALGKFDALSLYRVGGIVKPGSIHRLKDGISVAFKVTDCLYDVPVVYTGILPDLFREGQGVVANGRMSTEGVFNASQVLAKHDENYMPSEMAELMLARQREQCQLAMNG